MNGAAAVGLGGAGQPAALPTAAPVAVVVAVPVIANLAGALVPPGPVHPRFDIEAALQLCPLPTKSNVSFQIHAKIN